MSKLSVIIPSRNELFLNKTIEDLLAKAEGEIEIIAVLDGYTPTETIRENWSTPAYIKDPRVRYLQFNERKGLRFAINAGVAVSKGDYIMKSDAHCMFETGFDTKLTEVCDDNYIVIPRRNRLEPESWTLSDTHKTPFDYHYLTCPFTSTSYFAMENANWFEMSKIKFGKPEFDLDDTMTFQGSLWFMKKDHFTKRIGPMDIKPYWGWEQEPQELGNRTWLGGGRVIVYKKTWYAHLHKGSRYGRMYHMDKNAITAGHEYSAKYWLRNSWKGQIHKFSWLVEKFNPPTWPADWEKQPIPL